MLTTLLSLALVAQASPAIYRESSSGQPLLATEFGTAPLKGEFSTSARAWLLERPAVSGLAQGATLRFDTGFSTRLGGALHYKVEVGGLEVQGAKVVLSVDAAGRVLQVASSAPAWTSTDLRFQKTEAEALRIAAAAVPMAALAPSGLPAGAVFRRAFVQGSTAVAGYWIALGSPDVTKNWRVSVDARTGEVLSVVDLTFRASNDAQVFRPSPGGAGQGVGIVTPSATTLTHPDGSPMVSPNAGGFLLGSQLDTYNCCINEGCDVNGKPKTIAGSMKFGQQTVNYEAAVCDRKQLATNDPAAHASGDYVYAPVDPPAFGPVSQADPASSDAFAEVHAFYHVNTVYDWVRALSGQSQQLFPNQPALQPFAMRDERRTPPQKFQVWTNMVIPDFQSFDFSCILTGQVCKLKSLAHVDNAAFSPREQGQQMQIPGFSSDVDALMIFQGEKADFAYDAPVLWHEFGHGVVYSTAGLQPGNITLDARSANDEGGALHEGIADYIAGAFGGRSLIGEYVGPRISGTATGGMNTDSYLRNLDNTLACPSVLWGEVHQDSQHLSGALWEARTTLFQGNDKGATFDAAVYAAVVSMAPNANFASFAKSVSLFVKAAFGASIPDADKKMDAVFEARGVIGCDKVLNVPAVASPRKYYGIPSAQAWGGFVPGPIQFKLDLPKGAKRIKVSAVSGGGGPGGGFGGGTPTTNVQLVAKIDAPVTFERKGTSISNDGLMPVPAKAGTQGDITATDDLQVPCGSALYVVLGVADRRGATLQNVKFETEPLDSCPVDAGIPDAGGDADAGVTSPAPVDALDAQLKAPALPGCGCGETGGLLAGAVLLLGALRRRRNV